MTLRPIFQSSRLPSSPARPTGSRSPVPATWWPASLRLAHDPHGVQDNGQDGFTCTMSSINCRKT